MNSAPTLSDCAQAIRQCIERFLSRENALSDSQFDSYARQIFAEQWRLNTPYRLYCQRSGRNSATVDHWSQIPAMPAAAFKELEVSCLPPEQRQKVFHSSGTTLHQPSRHYHSADSLRLYEASALAGFSTHVTGNAPPAPEAFRQRCLCLTPSPARAPHSSLVHMFETIRQRAHFSDFTYVETVDAEAAWMLNLERAVELLSQNRREPVLLLGTAFSYVQLVDHLRAHDRGIQLPAGSTAMETGGYKGRSRVLPKTELHELIQGTLGIAADRIVCEYGMSELSSQAYDCAVAAPRTPSLTALPTPTDGLARVFQFPTWARGRVVSPEDGQEVRDGETGLMRIIDLANVYSVAAVQTEDLAIRRGGGFELLGRVAGAENRGCSILA